jgi:hypothetical protein
VLLQRAAVEEIVKQLRAAEQRLQIRTEESEKSAKEREARIEQLVRDKENAEHEIRILKERLMFESDRNQTGRSSAPAHAAAGDANQEDEGEDDERLNFKGYLADRALEGTKAKIKRDKDVHRLELNRVEERMQPHVAKSLLIDIARELELNDVSGILPNVRKMIKVMAAVPKMEQFVRDVCSTVFGTRFPRSKKQSVEEVIPTLQQWVVDLDELKKLREFQAVLTSELKGRPSQPGDRNVDGVWSTVRIATAIEELVATEKSIMAAKETYKTVDMILKTESDVLVTKIVRHFMQLFEVKSSEGIFPKLNEVYLAYSEFGNFKRVLKSMVHPVKLGEHCVIHSWLHFLSRR